MKLYEALNPKEIGEIIAKWKGNCVNCPLLNVKNGDASCTYENSGIEDCTGKILAWLNSDISEIDPSLLVRRYETMTSEEIVNGLSSTMNGCETCVLRNKETGNCKLDSYGANSFCTERYSFWLNRYAFMTKGE